MSTDVIIIDQSIVIFDLAKNGEKMGKNIKPQNWLKNDKKYLKNGPSFLAKVTDGPSFLVKVTDGPSFGGPSW